MELTGIIIKILFTILLGIAVTYFDKWSPYYNVRANLAGVCGAFLMWSATNELFFLLVDPLTILELAETGKIFIILTLTVIPGIIFGLLFILIGAVIGNRIQNRR